MKKILYLIITCLTIITISGCKKNIKPKDEIPSVTNVNKIGAKIKKMNIDFNDVTYKNDLDKALENIKNANNYDEIYDYLISISPKTNSMINKYLVADALVNYDPDNTTYVEKSKTLTNAYYDYVDFYNNLVVELAKNDEYLENFFSDYTADEIEFTVNECKKKLDENYIKLNKELDEIRDEADKIEINFKDNADDEKLLELMYDYVNKNKELAKIMEYDSYITYADLMRGRSYTQTDVDNFISNTKKYLLPLMANNTDFIDIIAEREKLSRSEYNYLVEFNTSSIYDKDYSTYRLLDEYAKKMGGSYYSTYADFMDNGYFIFANKTNSLVGAYTNRYMCYFGPNNQDAKSVAHEFGHYFSQQNDLLLTKSLDLKEYYSQANAFLFASYLEQTANKTLKKIYNTDTKIMVADACKTIVVASALREFEEKLYTTTLTDKNDIKTIWNEINQNNYNGYLKDYWKLEIRYDLYYLSYATSVTGAVGLYNMSQNNLNDGIKTYIKTVNNQSLDDDIDEILAKAGLNSPFSEEAFINIVNTLEGKR